MSGLGGHGEGPRRNRDDAAGAKPGTSPVDRNAVNVGTAHVAVPAFVPARDGDRDRRVVSRRACAGRSRRSTPRSRSRPHGEGRQRASRGDDCDGPRRAGEHRCCPLAGPGGRAEAVGRIGHSSSKSHLRAERIGADTLTGDLGMAHACLDRRNEGRNRRLDAFRVWLHVGQLGATKARCWSMTTRFEAFPAVARRW